MRGVSSGRARVFIVTGEPGAGKSTVCARVAEEARVRGLAVAGLLTIAGALICAELARPVAGSKMIGYEL